MPDLMTLSRLRDQYRSGQTTPLEVIDRLLAAADAHAARNIWITRLTRDEILRHVRALEGRPMDALPLFGIPFAIKDNIDLEHVPTTAACPRYRRVPTESATVVRRLIDAGAIPIGKTNLDQFATGLVGTRSPYGACGNSVDADFISGGSSSGSAVAVALGLAAFSLGTDTAGSGRVPAAFNNLIGLKPTLGRLSTRGVVPACRSLDVVSIFALNAADAAAVLAVAEGFDPEDPYARRCDDRPLPGARFGVPRPEQLRFFGDADYARLFEESLLRVQEAGGQRVTIDFEPFLETARLLYEGPWLAERCAAVGRELLADPEALLPVTRQVIEGGRHFTAIDAFESQYRLQALKRVCGAIWSEVDFIVTPTAGTIYRIAAVEADPVRLNATLGYYTNFMNLLDLAGVAAPAGFRGDGLPFGITLAGPAGTERALLAWADRVQRSSAAKSDSLEGASPAQAAVAPAAAPTALAAAPVPPLNREEYVSLAVCGAHMSGLPLNGELRSRGAYLLGAARTAAHYRLYALPGGPPHRPGLVRTGEGGSSIELELWALPASAVGAFIAGIPAPLGVGRIELADGSSSLGFLCEAFATQDALDISHHGGWRAYQSALR